METVIGFVTGIMLSWWFIFAIFFMAIISDYTESKKDEFGWAAFYTVVATVCLYFHLDPSGAMIGMVLLAWLPIGMLWSIAKWKIRINKTKYEIQTNKLEPHMAHYILLQSRLNIDNVKSTVTYWVICWPISMVSTCFVNVFDFVEYIITVKMGKMFKNMAEEAFK